MQRLTTNGEATSDSRDSFHDSGTGSDAEAGAEKSEHVGPTSNMSLLDQHSKLKLEALGSFCCKIVLCSGSTRVVFCSKNNYRSHAHKHTVFIH